jgi:hypothetical protein
MARKKVNQAKTRTQKVKFEAEKQLQAIQAAAEKRAKELQDRIEEAEREEQKALEEEKKQFEATEKLIRETTEENGYFCGVVLTKDDILTIVNMAIETKENIRIPFRLYILDDEENPTTQPQPNPELQPEAQPEPQSEPDPKPE